MNTSIRLGLIAILALTLRIAYMYQADESPLFDTPMVDARTYVETALKLAGGAWAGKPEPFWQAPLYPYSLGVLYTLFGEGYYLPRLLQAVAGTATCILLFFLGRQAFSPAVGWLAAGLAAFYGPFIYFEGELLPVGPAVFLNVLLLLVLLWAAQREGAKGWFAAGLLLGLSGLLVANVFLFVPIVFLWALYFLPASSPAEAGKGGLRRPRPVQLAAFVLGIALLVAPVTLRNRIVGGEWVLVSYNAGVNFYVGNNPDYDEKVETRPGEGWIELVNLPKHEAGIIGRSAGSLYFFSKSWAFIAGDPVGYLGLMLRKVYLFWHGDEIRRNLDPYYARTYSPVLQTLLWKYGLAFPFGIIAPLALLGLGFLLRTSFRQNPVVSLVLLFTATYAFSVVLFFITGRYRLPVVPLLLLFAAYAVVQLWQQRGRSLALSAALLVILLVGSNAGASPMDPEGDAYEHYWKGMAFQEKGMQSNALLEFQRAVDLDPSHGAALSGLVALYAVQQQLDEAIDACQKLLSYYPDRINVRVNLADLLLMKAEYQQAINLYQSLVAQQPERTTLHSRLAQAYLLAGAPDKGITAYQQALALNPDSPQIHYQLARIYQDNNQPEEAMQEYGRLLELQPEHVDALWRLAALLAWRGKDTEAEPLLHKALSLAPHSIGALGNMAGLEAQRGNYEAALQHYQKIVKLDPNNFEVHQALARLYSRTGQMERAKEEYRLYEREKLAQQRDKAREVQEKVQGQRLNELRP